MSEQTTWLDIVKDSLPVLITAVFSLFGTLITVFGVKIWTAYKKRSKFSVLSPVNSVLLVTRLRHLNEEFLDDESNIHRSLILVAVVNEKNEGRLWVIHGVYRKGYEPLFDPTRRYEGIETDEHYAKQIIGEIRNDELVHLVTEHLPEGSNIRGYYETEGTDLKMRIEESWVFRDCEMPINDEWTLVIYESHATFESFSNSDEVLIGLLRDKKRHVAEQEGYARNS